MREAEQQIKTRQEAVGVGTTRPRGGMAAIRRMVRDRRGVGAVEFALLAPILLMIYISAFEITVGLSVAKRATRATGTVADLVTQQSEKVNKAFLATMSDVADSIFVPFSTRGLTLKISGITIDNANAIKVLWSWQKGGTRPYIAGSATSVPADLHQPNTFLIRTELSVPHELMMFMANAMSMETPNITISRQYFFRQRVGETIACTDC